jgi:hypothetical protein
MNFYSARSEIVDMYYEWIEQSNPRIMDCPHSLVGYLEGVGLLKDLKEWKIEHQTDWSEKQLNK